MLKKGKKLFVILLALCMVFIGICQVAFAEEPITDGVVNSTGTNAIEDQGEDLNSGNGGQFDGDGFNNEGNGLGDNDKNGENPPEPGDQDDEQEPVIGDLGDYLDEFRFYNSDTDEDYGAENTVKDGDTVGIEYSFYIPSADNAGIKSGSVLKLPALPDNIIVSENKINKEYELKDMDRNVLATWCVNDAREIVVTFTSGVEEHHSNITGTLELICSASVIAGKNETITFDLGPKAAFNKDFQIVYVPDENNPEIQVKKEGKLNKNTETIAWTITATANKNDRFATLAGYLITDTFDTEQMTLVENSVTVNGSTVAVTTTDEGFTYTFDQDFAAKTAEIKYETKVKSELFASTTQVKVENNVVLKMAEQMAGKDVTASANSKITVSDLFLQKDKGPAWSVYDEKEGAFLLQYAVEVRYAGTSAHILDVIANVNQNNYGKVAEYQDVKISYDKSAGKDEIAKLPNAEIVLVDGYKLKVDLDTAHKEAWVYYTVKIKDPKAISTFNANNYTKYGINNTAYLYLNNAEKAVASDYEDWDLNIKGQDNIIAFNKSGGFRVENDRYVVDENGNYIIDWTIDINAAKKDLTKTLTIIDTLGKGHTFNKDSVQFVGEDGKTVNGKVVEQYTNSGGYHVVKFEIKNLGPNSCQLKYTTTVSDLTNPYNGLTVFRNSATLKYEGIKDETINNREASTPVNNVIKKTGAYDAAASEYDGTRYYDWTIKVDDTKTKFTLNNVVLTDKLPTDHNLVAGSVKVGNQTIGTEKNGADAYYTLEKGTLKVYFNGTVTDATTVTFRTSTDTELNGTTKVVTKNDADINAKEFSKKLSSSTEVVVKYAPKLTKKSDYKDGDTANWEISINGGDKNSYITKQKATLVDELPPGLVYKDGTAELIAVDGSKISGELSVDYEESAKVLTFTLPDGLDLGKEYKLTFATKVTENITNVSNSITFDGSATETKATSPAMTLKNSALSGTISGENIRFAINKVDEKTKAPLAGAEFTLYEGNRVIQTAVSTADGTVLFDKGLRYDKTYSIVETKVPEGYQLDEKEYVLTVGTYDRQKKGAEVIFDGVKSQFTCNANNTLEITATVTNKAIEKKPEDSNDSSTPTPTPTPTPPVTPTPDPDPTPDPKPLPPDEGLEDPGNPGGDDDVVKPALPDDDHLELDKTANNKNDAGTKTTTENSDLPATGDQTQLILWTILLITSLSAAVAVVMYRRRIEKE